MTIRAVQPGAHRGASRRSARARSCGRAIRTAAATCGRCSRCARRSADFDAWITAIRRDQTPERANAPVVGWDGRFGLVKINPLVRWTFDDVQAYVREHDVPYNPLHDQDYPSIGCVPCTSPVMPGEDPRSGAGGGQRRRSAGCTSSKSKPKIQNSKEPVLEGLTTIDPLSLEIATRLSSTFDV